MILLTQLWILRKSEISGRNIDYFSVTLFLFSIIYLKNQDLSSKNFFAAYKSSRFDRRRLPLLPLAVAIATGVNTTIVDDNYCVFSVGRKKMDRSLTKYTAANRAITAASDFSTHARFFYFFPPFLRLPKEASTFNLR